MNFAWKQLELFWGDCHLTFLKVNGNKREARQRKQQEQNMET